MVGTLSTGASTMPLDEFEIFSSVGFRRSIVIKGSTEEGATETVEYIVTVCGQEKLSYLGESIYVFLQGSEVPFAELTK